MSDWSDDIGWWIFGIGIVAVIIIMVLSYAFGTMFPELRFW